MASGSQTPRLGRLVIRSKTLFETTSRRNYATHADLPRIQPAPKQTTNPFDSTVIATTYRWPEIEPVNFRHFSSTKLGVPLRRDILHRAVVYEADAQRKGIASTKHRSNMRGSDKKLRPQKGTGQARLSDRKSPMLKGGGVAHGPHPRDFSTDLPSKIYSLAFRTALSHRYRKGELVVLENTIGKGIEEGQSPRWLHNIFTAQGWGQGNSRTMVVVSRGTQELVDLMEKIPQHAVLRTVNEVGVKDLLACGRVLVERSALTQLFVKDGLRKPSKPEENVTPPVVEEAVIS